jgi:hypothetical protein
MLRCSIRISMNKTLWKSQKTLFITFPEEGVVFTFSTSVRPSLNDLLQSYTWVLESVSSPNCAENLQISVRFTFLLVRNVIMRFATAEGTTCSLIAITTDLYQIHMQQYVITVIGSPSLATAWFCFTRESLHLRKGVRFIFELPIVSLRKNTELPVFPYRVPE